MKKKKAVTANHGLTTWVSIVGRCGAANADCQLCNIGVSKNSHTVLRMPQEVE